MKEFIKSVMDEEKQEVIKLRRELHKRAELSNEEYKTAEFVEDYLNAQGLKTCRVFNTGVVAYLDCGAYETILLRADMDALPVTETDDVGYKSQTEGVMHACGHDAHMAVLLCAAKVFCKIKDSLCKNILFVFQPAEESDGGAEPMIKEGILKEYNVTEALGLHVSNEVPAGKIMIKPGSLMASPDDFVIKIIGRGGHGSAPEKCLDPIAVAGGIIKELNFITKEIIKEGESQLVQVCTFHGGSVNNIIPDTVEITGTARSFLEDVRRQIPEKMESIIKEACKKYGLEYEFTFNYRYPPLINDADVAQKMKSAVEEYMGDIVITWEKPSMIGEDFAYFARCVPANFFYLGTGNEEKGAIQPLHSSRFTIDEDGLITGVGVYLSYILGKF